MKQDKFYQIGESLDKLITVDISARGSIGVLYKAARKLSDEPLTLRIAKIIQENVKAKDKVILTTGWIDQPVAAPNFGETDGPGGTVILARALRLICKASCIIYTDEQLVEGMKKVAQAAGFHCVEPEQLDDSLELDKLMTIAILPFPVDNELAQKQAVEVIKQYKPACCIAIERGGMNDSGHIHSMSGKDTSKSQAKTDYIFQEANKNNIATIGIGDGGNEIGMGNIKKEIREQIVYGDKCLCECKEGIAPTTKVTALLAAVISNWGCYAVCNLLAALNNKLEYLHTPSQEKRVLKNAADSGFHDAIFGGVEYSVDGCALPVQMAMVEIMQETVKQGMKKFH